MGAESNNNDKTDMNRQPQQQPGGASQQNPNQQNQQKGDAGQSGGQAGGQSGQRIDTDNDGRTRDPSDTSPTDNGGKGAPVQR